MRHAHSADGDPKDDDPYAVALVTRDPRTLRTTVLSDRARTQGPVARDRIPGNALQIHSVSVVLNVIVWIEASNPTHGDLYVHDMSEGTERRLVRSSALATGPTPVVHGEHVYYVGVEGDDLDAAPPRTSVYRVPVDGAGEPELVAPGAVDVHLDGAEASAPGDRLRVVFADRVVTWDPREGADGEVADTSLPADCGAAAGDGVTLTCNGSPRQITINTWNGRIEPAVDPGTVGDLHANGHWVAFTTDVDGDRVQYVFDVAREKFMKVPPTRVLRGLHTGSPELAVLAGTEPASTATVIEFVR